MAVSSSTHFATRGPDRRPASSAGSELPQFLDVGFGEQVRAAAAELSELPTNPMLEREVADRDRTTADQFRHLLRIHLS
jgi:hypothetical protein